jgi:hypothetical protein
MTDTFIYTPALCEVKFGELIISTPNVLSAGIKRSRGQVSKASVSLKISDSTEKLALGLSGGGILIRFQSQNVFRGIIVSINSAASGDCAGNVILNITAEDELYKLRNKRITRRQKLNGIGPIAMITNIEERAFLGFDDPPSLYDIDRTFSPISVVSNSPNFREMNNLLSAGQSNTISNIHPTIALADPMPKVGPPGGGGGLGLHTHEKLDLSERGGGPAFAVFSSK